MSNHGDAHWDALVRSLKYAYKTRERGLVYTEPDDGRLDIKAYSDASLGENPDSRASRVGYFVMVNGAYVSGKSTLLKRAQISSTGAELHGLSLCGHEIAALRNQLLELGEDISVPTILMGDNQSSIMVAENPGAHRSQLRHLELHAFAIRDLVREGQCVLKWVDTASQIADVLTKSVGKTKFEYFSKFMLGEELCAVATLTAHCVLVDNEFQLDWY
jgi:hypothetical protein